MKRGIVLLLLIVLAAVGVYLFRAQSAKQNRHEPLQSQVSEQASRQPSHAESVTTRPWLANISPRQQSGSTAPGYTQEDSVAAAEAAEGKHPLDALRELAEDGNSPAAYMLGDKLIGCRLGALQDVDDSTSRFLARLARARNELKAAKRAGSSSSSRIELLAQRVKSLQQYLDAREKDAKAARSRCAGVSVAQAWQGFGWLDRAVKMGYQPAMKAFVRTVEKTFARPAAVGRNPRKAMQLRERARGYLSNMMQECDKGVLWLYAWSVPILYQLDDQQRLAAGELAMQSIVGNNVEPDYLANMRRRLEIDDLQSRLSASQIASAKRQAAAIHRRCLGTDS